MKKVWLLRSGLIACVGLMGLAPLYYYPIFGIVYMAVGCVLLVFALFSWRTG